MEASSAEASELLSRLAEAGASMLGLAVRGVPDRGLEGSWAEGVVGVC